MDSDLREILDRLDWARTETESLKREIAIWVDGSFRVYSQPDQQPGFNSIMMEAKTVAPVSIRARSGTTTNEIRSCLDALASVLAERNGKGSAYFPIADEEGAFKTNRRLKDRLKKFRDADRDALLAFRPFAKGDDGQPGNLLLYGLHHADIKRKHHRLVAKAASSQMGFNQEYVGSIRNFNGNVALPGITKIAMISSDSTARIRFEPILLYAEPNVLRSRPLVKTLHDFANVAETVVRAFL